MYNLGDAANLVETYVDAALIKLNAPAKFRAAR